MKQKKWSIRERSTVLSIINLLLAAAAAWLLQSVAHRVLTYGLGLQFSRSTVWFITFFFATIILNLAVLPIIFSPLRKLSENIKEYAAGTLSESDLAEFPEMQELVATFTEIVNSMKREKDLAKAMYETSRDRARMVDTDHMTQLYNKSFLYAILPLEILRSKILKDEFAVVMIDIDNFKLYNDTNGHLAGDALLIMFADLLKRNTRSLDLCVRYGGEEFAIVLTRTPERRAIFITERIRKVIEETAFRHREKQTGGKITASFGIAIYPRHASSVDELLRNADTALLRAKSLGKNRVCIYGEESGGEEITASTATDEQADQPSGGERDEADETR
jgi:diguanylate cyclase (GGDEF)-like protein